MSDARTRPLEARQALVCGASRGIGRACAIELARQGARVSLCARSEEGLRQVLRELEEASASGAEGRHRTLPVDFEDPTAVGEAVRGHLKETGTIHILVNNTGGPPGGPLLQAEPESFRSTFNRHLICDQILAQLLVPGMKEAGYGRIINIVSTSVRQPIRGLGVSNTVRAAVASWAKTLATELAPYQITVNNVLPGATETDRLREIVRERARSSRRTEAEVEAEMKGEIPAGRFARPEEIATAVAFLASPAAAYITGISLPVDGGRTQAL